MSDFLGGSGGGGGDVAAHEAAADPHTGYRLESDTTVIHPNETKTNSTTADQDFTSIFTIPASDLTAVRVYEVELLIQYVSDASASSQNYYLKLGTTKVFTTGAPAPGNNSTRNMVLGFRIFGTAAAGAAVNVNTSLLLPPVTAANQGNVTAQPVALATNGTLAIVFGVAFGTATGGESLALLSAIVKRN